MSKAKKNLSQPAAQEPQKPCEPGEHILREIEDGKLLCAEKLAEKPIHRAPTIVQDTWPAALELAKGLYNLLLTGSYSKDGFINGELRVLALAAGELVNHLSTTDEFLTGGEGGAQ